MNETKLKLDEVRQSCIVIDIETSSQYPEGDKIDIKTNFEDYVKYAKVKFVGMYSYLHDEYIEVQVLGNEEIIKDYIAQHKVIISFNGEEFDIPIMYNNNLMPDKKRFLQVDCLVTLGASSFQRHDGLAFKNRGALMGYKFKNNSLKEIAKGMNLETQKGDIDYVIFFKNSWTEEEMTEIKKYLRGDVKATKEMFDKLWEFWYPFTEWLDEKNVLNLSWIRSAVASLTYKCDCNTLGVEETYGEHSEKIIEEMGGRVIEPKYEEARKVWYVDFASLYPHIDIMFNIFAEVDQIINKDNIELCKTWHGNDMFKVKGYYDISEHHPLAKDLAEKIALRMKLKREDPTNPLIYALKIFANAKYGIQRSPIFEQVYTPNAGWDICWLGQQFQKYTEQRMSDFGFETIAGDTDSIFVVKNTSIYPIEFEHGSKTEEEYVKHCLKIIVDEIKANVPFPVDTFNIDIEEYIDYIMWPFSMQPIQNEDGTNKKNEKGRLIKELKGKKKNYLYLYKKNGELHMKLKGLPIIKDNATPLSKKILKEALEPMILNKGSAKFTKQEINEIIKIWLAKPEALHLLAREFKCKTDASYKLNKDGTPSNNIYAQISRGYFGGQSGVVNLIKNKKIGRAGQTAKYCTYEEAIENNLDIKDLDLTKLTNELSPFVENKK